MKMILASTYGLFPLPYRMRPPRYKSGFKPWKKSGANQIIGLSNHWPQDVSGTCSSGWWIQTFFIFHNIWDNPSHWLIFFRGIEATNQAQTIPSSCYLGTRRNAPSGSLMPMATAPSMAASWWPVARGEAEGTDHETGVRPEQKPGMFSSLRIMDLNVIRPRFLKG